MAKAPLPDIHVLRQCILYDAATGDLTWAERDASSFVDHPGKTRDAACKAFNKRYAGKPALSAITSHGYRSGSFMGRRIYAHRAAWAIHHGAWPKLNIDHIDGDPLNNKISNLREVTQSMNLRNTVRSVQPRSGHPGVFKLTGTRSKPWCAKVQVNKRAVFLGNFATPEEADIAVRSFRLMAGFTERHYLPSHSA